MPLTLSVLICTYNRHEMLMGALEALIERTSEKPEEVVVVNGGSEEADRVVESFRGRHGIALKLVNTINKNLAASRNVGLAHCSKDIIAMTDDDAEVFPDWVTRMKESHLRYARAGAVGGPVLGARPDRLLDKMAEIVTFPYGLWEDGQQVSTLAGVNVSYKRDAVLRLGGQDEALPRGEDVDYNWRLRRLGYEIIYDRSIQVYHHNRPDVGSFMRQHHMYGRSYYLVRRKWSDMYSLYPRGLHAPKDILKAGHFLLLPVYRPLLQALQLRRWSDRLLALPVFVAVALAWQAGVLLQCWKSRRVDGR